MDSRIETLKNLYRQCSKHSQYQLLCNDLQDLFPSFDQPVKPRYEPERLRLILQTLDPVSKKIVDIGANTGFFSFELLKAGAESIFAYEGNKAHADFLRLAADILNVSSRISIKDHYFLFSEEEFSGTVDIILLLNVLHHVGDDFGDSADVLKAKEKMLDYLNKLAKKTRYLVFQLGFCWKGNRETGLFPGGTKKEMIDFVLKGTEGYWKMEKVGVPEKGEGCVEYKEVSSKNIQRDDNLGEFLNRPIFILKSRDDNA